MFCPKCGNTIPDNATNCPKCGEKLPGKPLARGRFTNWNVMHYMIVLLSALSIVCLLMKWFDLRFLELLTDGTRFSVIGLLSVANKVSSYIGFLDPDMKAADLLFSEEFGLTVPYMIGMGVCAILFALAIVQMLVKEKADLFCAASIFSVPFSLAMRMSFPGTSLVVLTSWIWVYLILCLFNLIVFFVFSVKK